MNLFKIISLVSQYENYFFLASGKTSFIGVLIERKTH